MACLEGQRDDPFDIVLGGATLGDPAKARDLIAPLTEAGATWWDERQPIESDDLDRLARAPPELREEACLAGTVQTTLTPYDGGRRAELSWVVGRPWQGRGLATEAARGLVAWLWSQAEREPVREIVAHVHPAHRASAAVDAAAGLTHRPAV